MKESHGEEGHLNIYERDHDSFITAYGKHARVVVFQERDGTPCARVDYKHEGLERPSDEQIRKVMKNPFYGIKGRWKVLTREEYFSNGCNREDVSFVKA